MEVVPAEVGCRRVLTRLEPTGCASEGRSSALVCAVVPTRVLPQSHQYALAKVVDGPSGRGRSPECLEEILVVAEAFHHGQYKGSAVVPVVLYAESPYLTGKNGLPRPCFHGPHHLMHMLVGDGAPTHGIVDDDGPCRDVVNTQHPVCG